MTAAKKPNRYKMRLVFIPFSIAAGDAARYAAIAT
jgi:hypothetical protein